MPSIPVLLCVLEWADRSRSRVVPCGGASNVKHLCSYWGYVLQSDEIEESEFQCLKKKNQILLYQCYDLIKLEQICFWVRVLRGSWIKPKIHSKLRPKPLFNKQRNIEGKLIQIAKFLCNTTGINMDMIKLVKIKEIDKNL